MTPVMRVDLDGKAFFSILGTLAVGALIGGVVGLITAAINGDDLAAGFFSGALSGAISAVGIALAVATGGLGGIAFAGIFGYGAGYSSSVLQQGMTNGWGKIDHGKARKVGRITALASIMTFGVTRFIAGNSVGAYERIVDKSLSLGTRIGNAMKLSAESFLTALFVDLPTTTASSIAIVYYNKTPNGSIIYDIEP
jgi:hypothetical protein